MDTPWHKGEAPKIAISAEQAVSRMLLGLRKEREEIRIGSVRPLYLLHRLAPAFALKKLNSLEQV